MGRGMGGFGMRRGVSMLKGCTPNRRARKKSSNSLKIGRALKQQLSEINRRIDELASED